MASMEPPRYTESFQEFEMPSYASSFQQLQNLPPPLTDEPSLIDSSIQAMSPYEMQPTSSIILMDNSEPIPPPYGENTLNLSHPQQFHVNQNTKFETPMEQVSQSFGDYSNTGVDDKIKDILARYNPHAPNTNVPKQEPTIDPYRGNQTYEASLPSQSNTRSPSIPQQVTRPSVPQVTEIQKSVQYQTPLQSKPNQYSYPPQPIQPVSAPPAQPTQIRARVVQNLPSNPTTQSPSPQRFQQQPNLTSGSPQIHPNTAHQQPPVQVYQPTLAPPPAQVSPAMAHPTVVPQSGQTDASYLQLVQQQAIQFSLQNQQIQNLQNLQNQQSKELLDKMQSYFEKINFFMERSEKRLISLEQTAQSILKKGSNNDDVSSFIPKGELELLKKMQDQMESDYDIAKRLQSEMDAKYNKEKKEEKRKEKKEKKSSSSNSSSSKSPTSSSMQECPICTLKVPFSDLELHVNQCLESIEKGNGETKDTTTQEKASFWRRVFGPGPKKNTEDKDSKSTSSPSRPALPAPPTSSTASVSTPSPTLYPPGQDFYQMPFVYRGGYPQPQMVTPQGYYPYPGQQIYYIPPPGMPQPPTQGKK